MDDTPNADKDTETKRTHEDQSPESDTADSSADVKAPFAPHEDDDSALGDTDQHSTA
jgi:hypothetical protein